MKSFNAPIGPSFDLECANVAITEPLKEIKSIVVKVEHFGGTEDRSVLISQTDVIVTNAEPTLIQINQVVY